MRDFLSDNYNKIMAAMLVTLVAVIVGAMAYEYRLEQRRLEIMEKAAENGGTVIINRNGGVR